MTEERSSTGSLSGTDGRHRVSRGRRTEAVRGILTAGTVGAMLAGCALVSGGGDELRNPEHPAAAVTIEDMAWEHITVQAMDSHVEFLGSDRAQGRNGSRPGGIRVAAWVASQFQLAGLQPGGDDGGFLRYCSHTDAQDDTTLVPNVIALAPGADGGLENDFIVLLARFGNGDSTRGVDSADAAVDFADEAVDLPRSAVAVLVEIGRAVGAFPAPLRRPVLLVAVSAQNTELRRARGCAVQPVPGIEGAAAVIAIGEVGTAGARTLMVEGYERSSIGPLLAQVAGDAPGLELQVLASSDPAFGGILPAVDEGTLARRAVPAVGVWTAPSGSDGGGGPLDNLIDVDVATRVARLLLLTAHRLASADEPDRARTHQPAVGGR
jgi:aminopeptidase N